MRTLIVVGAALALMAASCSSSGGGEIVVEDAWGRSSPAVAANGAFYMVLKGGDVADRLVSADAEVCGATELHQTTMADGVMKMQQVDGGIEIPAGGEAVLEPGGFHIMCINKTTEFKVGDTYPITLEFESAASQTIDAEIREG